MSDFRGNIERERFARVLAERLCSDPTPPPIPGANAKILAGEYVRARSIAKALNQIGRASKGWEPAPEQEKWPPTAPSPLELQALRDAGFGRIADWCLTALGADLILSDEPTTEQKES